MLTAAIMRALEEKYPSNLAASWDNSGLQVGSSRQPVTKVVVALDCTAGVVEQAEREKAEMIITHHPLIFSGIKRINFDQAAGRLLQRLCADNISVYSLHTNLDRAKEGLNAYLASRLGLADIQVFGDLFNLPLYKLVVYVPASHLEPARAALGAAGAGHIGEYSHCTFAAPGEGTFLPAAGTHPFIGQVGVLERVQEYRLESIVDGVLLGPCIEALRAVHPYEEMAYEVYPLQQPVDAYGYGRCGRLPQDMTLGEAAALVKERLGLNHVRLVGESQRLLSRLAVVSGSGAGLIAEAAAVGAQVLVTGDVKYHEAQEAVSRGLALIDAGHDGLERPAVELLAADLEEFFPAGNLQVIPYHEELLFTVL